MTDVQHNGDTDQFRAHCYYAQCDKTFDSVNDMVPVAGKGDRSPRHFCEECAERIRRGPPLTDGGRDQLGDGIDRGDGPLADTSLLTEGRQRAPYPDRPVLFARDDRPRHDRVVFWEGGRLFGDRWIIVDGKGVEEVGEYE